MEISYRGANCIVIKHKQVTIVVDPTENASAKEIKSDQTLVLATQAKFIPADTPAFIVSTPGEYEHLDVSIKGFAAPAYLAADKKDNSATIYKININGVKIAVLGHIHHEIDEAYLEDLGEIDIVIVPVGGGGTLDAVNAASLARQLSAKLVIPTNYNDGQTKYEVPQEDLSNLEKEMGHNNIERLTVCKIKDSSALPAVMATYELSRTR